MPRQGVNLAFQFHTFHLIRPIMHAFVAISGIYPPSHVVCATRHGISEIGAPPSSDNHVNTATFALTNALFDQHIPDRCGSPRTEKQIGNCISCNLTNAHFQLSHGNPVSAVAAFIESARTKSYQSLDSPYLQKLSLIPFCISTLHTCFYIHAALKSYSSKRYLIRSHTH